MISLHHEISRLTYAAHTNWKKGHHGKAVLNGLTARVASIAMLILQIGCLILYPIFRKATWVFQRCTDSMRHSKKVQPAALKAIGEGILLSAGSMFLPELIYNKHHLHFGLFRINANTYIDSTPELSPSSGSPYFAMYDHLDLTCRYKKVDTEWRERWKRSIMEAHRQNSQEVPDYEKMGSESLRDPVCADISGQLQKMSSESPQLFAQKKQIVDSIINPPVERIDDAKIEDEDFKSSAQMKIFTTTLFEHIQEARDDFLRAKIFDLHDHEGALETYVPCVKLGIVKMAYARIGKGSTLILPGKDLQGKDMVYIVKPSDENIGWTVRTLKYIKYKFTQLADDDKSLDNELFHDIKGASLRFVPMLSKHELSKKTKALLQLMHLIGNDSSVNDKKNQIFNDMTKRQKDLLNAISHSSKQLEYRLSSQVIRENHFKNFADIWNVASSTVPDAATQN